MRKALLAAAFLWPLVAEAQGLDEALRPVKRPLAEISEAGPAQTAVLRPRARPDVPLVAAEAADTPQDVLLQEPMMAAASALLAPQALRPQLRPDSIVEQAILRRKARESGAVCGDLDIQGEEVGIVTASHSQCGIQDAVKVRSVMGVTLSQKATIDCTTAKALKSWVKSGLMPAVGNTGGGLAKLNIMGHFACRPRNNQPGAKISEHGKGRAVDIGGMTLRDGTKISVLNDWDSRRKGRILKTSFSKACGIFGTVLGPRANRFHQDHFHFDTARYRSGAYCK